MAFGLDDLKKQLAASEAELEHAKAHLYRLDGVIQMLKHFIADAEMGVPSTPISTDDPPKD